MRGKKWDGLNIVKVNGRSMAKGTCQVCGNEILYNPYKSFGKFCSRKCSSIDQKTSRCGHNNHNWKGGYDDNYGPSWEQSRLLARLRDNVCQGCGANTKQTGEELNVHHIKPFREFGIERHEDANQLDNLICYCRSCHMSAERLQDKFQSRYGNTPKKVKRNPQWKPRDTSKTIQSTCPVCGKIFYYYKSRPLVHCSRKCQVASLDAKRVTVCPQCGREFTYLKSWPRKFCSSSCAVRSRNLEKPAIKLNAICITCGNKFEYYPKSSRGKFCSFNCFCDHKKKSN